MRRVHAPFYLLAPVFLLAPTVVFAQPEGCEPSPLWSIYALGEANDRLDAFLRALDTKRLLRELEADLGSRSPAGLESRLVLDDFLPLDLVTCRRKPLSVDEVVDAKLQSLYEHHVVVTFWNGSDGISHVVVPLFHMRPRHLVRSSFLRVTLSPVRDAQKAFLGSAYLGLGLRLFEQARINEDPTEQQSKGRIGWISLCRSAFELRKHEQSPLLAEVFSKYLMEARDHPDQAWARPLLAVGYLANPSRSTGWGKPARGVDVASKVLSLCSRGQ